MDPISFIIQIVVGVVLSIASTLMKQAFSPKQDQKSTGTRGSAQVGGKVPQYFLVGTVGDPGKFEYGGSWGNAGGVPNAYSVDVYSFGDLSITAMSRLFVNGVAEPVSGSGHVTQGYPTTGDKAGNLWVEFLDGNQTTVSSYLTGKFGSDPDRPWGADMIGRGVPSLITTALWSESLWTGFPSFVGEFQGIPLYDPRQDTTAGGSGAQRWDDPSTWAFSDNNLVIVYNIERGIHYNPAGATTLGAHIWGGNKTAAQLPYTAWAAAMDACDLPINLVGGGTEKQFRGGRKIGLNERPADVIKEFLIGANARICHGSDGTVWPLVGVPATADGAFTDADVLATEELGSIPLPNLDEIVNGATATYREPSQAWEDKETAPYYRSDLEAEDDGRRQAEGLDLGTTFSGTQAQRVLKAVVEEGRRFRRHVVALPAGYAQFHPLQVLAWTSDRFGYDGKMFLITVRTRPIWGWVVLGLQEVDPADHDWNPETDEQPLSFAPVVTNRPAPQTVSGFFVETVPGEVAYDAHWSALSVGVDVQFIRVSHRQPGGAQPRWSGLIPKPDLLSGAGRVYEALYPGETVEVQIEYMPVSGRATIASNWFEVEIADVRIGPNDLTEELNQQRAEAMRTIEQIQADRSRAIAQMADALAGRVVDLQTYRQQVSAQFQDTTAAYTLEITAVAGTVGALVDRTELLEASVNDPVTGLAATATALDTLRITVTADLVAKAEDIEALEVKAGDVSAGYLLAARVTAAPSGWDGAIQFGLRGEEGGEPSWVGLMIVRKNDGTGRIYLDADETIFRGKSRSVDGTSFIDWEGPGALRIGG